ncbi:MAG: phytanoyl-CoA dioxygenase family protein [Chloroflexia bacterium]
MNRATEANGCLQVVPRSHNDGLVQHRPTSEGVAILKPLVPEDLAVPVPMEPGSVLLMTQRDDPQFAGQHHHDE